MSKETSTKDIQENIFEPPVLFNTYTITLSSTMPPRPTIRIGKPNSPVLFTTSSQSSNSCRGNSPFTNASVPETYIHEAPIMKMTPIRVPLAKSPTWPAPKTPAPKKYHQSIFIEGLDEDNISHSYAPFLAAPAAKETPKRASPIKVPVLKTAKAKDYNRSNETSREKNSQCCEQVLLSESVVQKRKKGFWRRLFGL